MISEAADLVKRLRPAWTTDEPMVKLVSLIRPQFPAAAQALNDWLVANNAVKAEAAALIISEEAEIAKLREDAERWRSYVAFVDAKQLALSENSDAI